MPETATVDAVIDRVRRFAAHMNWRPATYARHAGLAANTLRDFHNDDFSPSANTLRKLEEVIPEDFEKANGEDQRQD